MKKNVNPCCWFEIYVNDINKAKEFYATVLNTELTDAELPDSVEEMQMAFFPGEENAPNASGALVAMKDVKPQGIAAVSTVIYFECDDCAVEESRVATAGGEVHKSKFSIGDYGFVSICLDPEGNTFGLHSLK